MKTTIAHGSFAFVAVRPDQNAQIVAREMYFYCPGGA